MNLTQEIVKELLDYDSKTGILIWKRRDIKWFRNTKNRTAQHSCNNWNSINAGNEAFSSAKLVIKEVIY